MQHKVSQANQVIEPTTASPASDETANSPSKLQLVNKSITDQSDNARYRMLFENSLDGVILSCPDGQVLEVNPSGCQILGRTAEEICRMSRSVLDAHDPRLAYFFAQRDRTGRAKGELLCKHTDGTTFPIEVSAVNFLDTQGQARSCIIFRDITDRKKAEKALQRSRERLRKALTRERQMARHDSLTGAYNIRAFFEIANAEVVRTQRYSTHYSLAYFDLDNFKDVNDRLGHAAGDDLLVSVVRAVQSAIRKSDVLARMGGDEFALLMPQTSPEAAVVVVRKVQSVLRDLASKAGWPVTASIGLVCSSSSTLSLREVLREADQLMYQAKRSGGNQIALTRQLQSYAAAAPPAPPKDWSRHRTRAKQ